MKEIYLGKGFDGRRVFVSENDLQRLVIAVNSRVKRYNKSTRQGLRAFGWQLTGRRSQSALELAAAIRRLAISSGHQLGDSAFEEEQEWWRSAGRLP